MSNKKLVIYLMFMFSALLTGCDRHTMADPAAYLNTAGEIPEEIWESLDERTRETIAEGVKYIALTFDDGPRYETTSVLLDGLLERDAKATFFVVGTQIACTGNEDLVRRMKAEGHQVGNHTYSHVRLSITQRDVALEEIQKNGVILETLLGEGEYWLRPPYGLIDRSRAALVKTPMIYWTLDPEDWKLLDAKKVADHVVANVKDGDIILLHDFYPSSVEAALDIIDRLQPEGYTFVTVEELFRIQGVEPENGVLYAAPDRVRPMC